ncbi:SDR family NAD(P)-dependent oxidoreductase [Agrobacterium sp. ICMP 6402]|nr:SDR family NAD(P)-dependent oxidoreductase [Agrobacterium sp. ICMP 6402]
MTKNSALEDRRVALVVGGASGSGKAAAETFLTNGYAVMLAGRNKQRLDDAVSDLARLGEVASVVADVVDVEQCDRMVSHTLERFGHIDALVNCAGVFGPFVHFLDLTRKDWDDEIEIHIHGVINASQSVARAMKARGKGGAIVNISSINAWQVEPWFTPHSVAKAAVIPLTRGMACDLAESRIRVNAVAPGWVNSPMAEADFQDIKGEPIDCNIIQRPVEPSEIGNIIYFLASPASSGIAGETIMADGGQVGLLTGIRTVSDNDRINRMRTYKFRGNVRRPGDLA